MELRSFCHSHFIQKVSSDGVSIVMNVSGGRPGLVFKKITSIYGFEDNLPLDKPSRLCQGNDDQPMVFGSKKIKAELPDPHMETEQVPDTSEDGDASESGADLDDSVSESMTLNQIKKMCKSNKRKRSISENFGPLDEGKGFEDQQDDFDLKDTLRMWKLKVKKNGRCKKKRARKYASSYQNAIVALKPERIFFDDHIPEYDWEMPIPLAIEFDDSYYNHSDYETAVCVGDSSYLDSETLDSHFLEYETVSEENDECVTHVENSPVLEPGISGAETPEDRMHDNHIQAEELEEECIINAMTQETPISASHFDSASHNRNYLTDSISSQLDGLGLCSPQKVVNDGSDAQTIATIISESLTQDQPKFADEHVKSADANTETNYLEETPPGNYAGQYTSPKQVENNQFLNVQHSSQRLFTARKVISPTSQEWLRKALRSNEESDEEYFYRCKGVHFKKQRKSKFARAIRTKQIRKCELPISPKRNQKHEAQEFAISKGNSSENAVAEQTSEELHGSPNNLTTQNRTKKCSPPKAADRSPQVSGVSPRLTMSCNTSRSCSENAVAFSQRQLQDIENLATRLMGELKSMKDIAEEASCSGGYTNPDEVRTCIENATKAEETARKWLSIMSRDCNRFCKIMKMSDNSHAVPPSPTAVQRGKRKISFADEAGKNLCHVKYFCV